MWATGYSKNENKRIRWVIIMLILGRNAVLEALNSDREFDSIYIKKGNIEGSLKKIIAKAKDKRILVKTVDGSKLDELSKNQNHQGVIAIANEYKYYELEELLNSYEKGKGLFIILDEIEDMHNFGAILRTAEAVGVSGVIIPKRRSVSVNETVEKTSAGATNYVKIARVSNIAQAMEKLQKNNIWIYALDMDGENYCDVNLSGDIAIVLGNEGKGISRIVKEKSDFVLSLPMLGRVNSLNVSVAGSVLMYEILRQRR